MVKNAENIAQIVAQKDATAIFTLKSDLFQNSENVAQYLDNFGKRICHQDLSQIAKSGHTVPDRAINRAVSQSDIKPRRQRLFHCIAFLHCNASSASPFDTFESKKVIFASKIINNNGISNGF